MAETAGTSRRPHIWGEAAPMTQQARTANDFVADWIAHNAAFHPAKMATLDLASGRRRSYAQLHERVARVAGFLRARGVGPGDRVAVLAMNSTDMLDIQFAAWRLGAAYLPINFRLTPAEIAYIVGDAGPALFIVDTAFPETVAAFADNAAVGAMVAMDGLGGDTAFERGVAAAEPVWAMVDQPRETLCMLMYSSGTTGRPKGVTFTHEMMVYAVMNTAPAMGSGNAMVGFSAMPLFHIGGLMAFSVSALYYGGSTVIMRHFDPGETLRAISDPALGITHLLFVPAMYNALQSAPEQPGADFSRIVTALAGAETVPTALVDWWMARGLMVQEVYGMTETCGGISVIPKSALPARVGSAGHLFPHVRGKVVRPDGAPAGVDEPGELWVSGGNVTPAYWQRPDANADSFRDGWLRTGDIVRIDAQGFLYIEDRMKDMYISGGENIYPAEVENVLYTHDGIAEVAVIGVPDSRWGETGCAVVVPRNGATLTRDHLVAHCEGRLAHYKHPAHVHLMDALPRNATGKVLKYQLREEVTRVLDLR
ncbi:hypothetical protein CKO24_12275 [Rhodothalassium salexigens DSM 2132]|nr:hypothetical protein [Rhodothalassium salexigens DSM 2132]